MWNSEPPGWKSGRLYVLQTQSDMPEDVNAEPVRCGSAELKCRSFERYCFHRSIPDCIPPILFLSRDYEKQCVDNGIACGCLPTNSDPFRQRVDNVHVASFHFLDPGASHGAYLDNAAVVGTLFKIIYNRANSYQLLSPTPGTPPDYSSLSLGPDAPRERLIWACKIMALCVPWLFLASVVTWLAAAHGAALGAAGLGLLAVAGLLGGYFGSTFKGQRKPF